MTGAVAITPALVAEHGLRPEEFRAIVERLGREPTLVELGIYSAMWSEHCAYKHSRPVLKLFPTEGPRVLVGPGENAGVIDLGDGLCVAFKMESHNHPSAVEPHQGAATGVGGILRDIFTMGARPIALLDNLRFGEPDDPAMQHLIEGVVEGIAGYGNCVGVPTVAGDVMFDPGHAGNILVNVMCVGVARTEEIVRARARGPGNAVLYFGSATGRDGIHGASFASAELSDEALERRGAVQVGDPFMGKKILEATLELIRRGLVVGLQDMGAAGLTCSTCEMAARAGTGIEIDLDRVPQRARGMSAYELLLSESQERMLAVCEPGKVEEALAVCERWECGGAVIGTVTDTGRMVIRHRGEVVADLPVDHLTHGAPIYHPPEAPPAPPDLLSPPPLGGKAVGKWGGDDRLRAAVTADTLNANLLALLATPTIASKRWAYRRYDHMVQTGAVIRPGDGDAAVVRVRRDSPPQESSCTGGEERDLLLAVTSGGNHRWVARDAEIGGQLVICESARNLVCVGAEPLGVTNCLNFGSPERPEVFGAFRRCVAGMAAACRALGLPVTGGNVSFYNESGGVPIPPTPMVGMVGRVADPSHLTRPGWRAAGDAICVLGPAPTGLGGSELAKLLLGPDAPGKPPRGPLPPFDLDAEVRLQRLVLAAIRAGLVHSAHDVSEGGLAVTLAECCLLARPDGRTREGASGDAPRPSAAQALGAAIDAAPGEAIADALFGELPPRVVVSVPVAALGRLEAMAAEADVECVLIGEVTEEAGLALLGCARIPADELRRAHETRPWPGLP